MPSGFYYSSGGGGLWLDRRKTLVGRPKRDRAKVKASRKSARRNRKR